MEPLVYRLVCKNGLICKDYAQKKYHVGRQVVGAEEAYEIYSDETLKQDDKAFFMKVQDTVRCAVDEARFQMTVDKLKESMQIPMEHDPVKEVEILADPMWGGCRAKLPKDLPKKYEEVYDILLDHFTVEELEMYRKEYGNTVLLDLYASVF